MRQTRCIDCKAVGRATARPAPYPGPRCAEHWREQKRQRSKAAHGRRIEANFDITETIYDAIYLAQGGRCFVCGRATGKARRLAVDHDHNCPAGHDPKTGCRQCIRCLACGPCNKDVLGRLDEAALRRAIIVLTDPPAQKILRAILTEESEFTP